MTRRNRVYWSQLVSTGLRLSTCLLALLLALDPSYPSPATADTAPWSEPVKISDETGGWFPDVAADDWGNVHVVWNSLLPESPGRDRRVSQSGKVGASTSDSLLDIQDMTSALYYSRWDGQGWSEPNDIALIGREHALRSALAVDITGRVHLAYKGLGTLSPEALGRSTGLGPEDIWYTSAPAGSRPESVTSWLPAKRISRNPQGYYSDIAIDSRGVIHLIWTESSESGWGIYYSHSTDGGASWSHRIALDGSNFVWWYRASLKVDAQDRLHVLWELTDLGRLNLPFGTAVGSVYALSSDGGETWIQTKFPENPSAPVPQQPVVGVDGNGVILLVFREQTSDAILYRRSTDGVLWSQPEPLPGVKLGIARPYDVYDTVTDSAGRVHLVTVGYPASSNTMGLLYSEWDGQNWSIARIIAESPPFPEYPRLAVGGGNRLHAVWFGGDRESVDRNPVGIWYSTAQTSAPKVARESPTVPKLSPAPGALAPATAHALPTPVQSHGLEPKPLRSSTNPTGTSPARLLDLQRWPVYPVIIGLLASVPLLAASLLAKHSRVLRR